MTVWIVMWFNDASDSEEIHGVYSTEEYAQQIAESIGGRADEWKVY